MSILFKRFVLCFCCICFLTFGLRPQSAHAVAGIDDAIVVGGGVTIGTGAIVALVGSSLVLGGTVLDANCNDGRVCKTIAQQMIATGNIANMVGVKVMDSGQQFLVWTKEGLTQLGSAIQSITSTGIPREVGGSIYLATGNAVRFTVKLSDGRLYPFTVFGGARYAGNYDVVIKHTTTTQDDYYINDPSGSCVAGGGCEPIQSVSVFSGGTLVPELPSASIDHYNQDTATKTLGKDVIGSDGTVSYAPTMGLPLVPNSTTGSLDYPNGIPYGKTAGDIGAGMTIPYPQSIPTDTPIDTPIDTPTSGTLDKDTGIFSIPVLGDILKILKKILDAILSIPLLLQQILDWFKVDTAEIAKHMDYAPIFREHFKPFYDISDLLTNIQSSPQTHNGKFYMKIPHEMGGDDLEHCVLDLSVAAAYISLARNIFKGGIWIAFLYFVFKVFSPKLQIGG